MASPSKNPLTNAHMESKALLRNSSSTSVSSGVWIQVNDTNLDAAATNGTSDNLSSSQIPAAVLDVMVDRERERDRTSSNVSILSTSPQTQSHSMDMTTAAPYETPLAPIEQHEADRVLQKQLSQAFLNLKEGKLSRTASNELLDQIDAASSPANYSRNIDPFAPEFQRIFISGYDDLHIARELAACDDLVRCAREICEALEIRRKYMNLAGQQFPSVVDRFLNAFNNKEKLPTSQGKAALERRTIQDHPIDPPSRNGKPYDCEIPQPSEHVFRLVRGSYEVYSNAKSMEAGEKPIHFGIERKDFWTDYQTMWIMMLDGPLKSFCFRKLNFLESKFLMHINLNEVREHASQKMVPHRDFYNIRKVDTHIHAASCMNQKHLLRFIKRTMRYDKDVPVVKDKQSGTILTLQQVFERMNLTTYDLNVDRLDVHADRNTFHRFDKFNAKYNPIGQSLLREIFLKIDNHLNGKYFANILKEVMGDLEESKYQNAEFRLSIYGRRLDEWDKLAKWAVDFEVWSPNVVWMIQMPRLYDIYKENNMVKSFEDVIRNLFEPLFEATAHPEKHPYLHRFLSHVSAFDSVDDESKIENVQFTFDSPDPDKWISNDNPAYAYYVFYMYSNMVALNNFRKERGFNTFVLRPHCGEAGPVNHMIIGFMLSESISHGLLLRKVPVLQYLFYLSQIGIAMSPLSNNSLFLDYNRNPLRDYFVRGLNVSLSTDDPLQFHFTKEPLMEEYSIAAQIWKLTSTDLSELARNSVLQSGFSDTIKQHWLGMNYTEEGVAGNDITRSNLPDVRIAYRYETLLDELTNIFEVVLGDDHAAKK